MEQSGQTVTSAFRSTSADLKRGAIWKPTTVRRKRTRSKLNVRIVKRPGWWIVAVTVVDGPDDDHPIIIRLTLSTHGRRETTAVASIHEACDQLAEWLDQVATKLRR
jgi:hypothetical protein